MAYRHRKTADGGDIYLTEFGVRFAELLDPRNWYEYPWFAAKRERLKGTSAVFRVPTREVDGQSIELVVKNCRVGEDVPLATHTLREFINAEFNSPWEEFSLVMELRESRFGPARLLLHTQRPLAIYVPPERMQIWQSGRSQARINRITDRHPGIDLDILRQYKMIYLWIGGKSAVQLLEGLGLRDQELDRQLEPLTAKAMADLKRKGFVMADMKPDHIIISQRQVQAIEGIATADASLDKQLRLERLNNLLLGGDYALVDYELLMRTAEHEEEVSSSRRLTYLEDQRDRYTPTGMPPHLRPVEVLGVPYVFGHAESTGGKLWVVGRNARLFDYFLPERWRKTQSWRLSDNNDVSYTYTKDRIHIVWKASRVGESLPPNLAGAEPSGHYAFNSPFEASAIARDLNRQGVLTVYVRAIYVTGTSKLEASADAGPYESHRGLIDPDGEPILRADRNYITILGYFNGPDEWVAGQQGRLCRPVDLQKAVTKRILSGFEARSLYESLLLRLRNCGYDGRLLQWIDLRIAIQPDAQLLKIGGLPQLRICNLELLRKL